MFAPTLLSTFTSAMPTNANSPGEARWFTLVWRGLCLRCPACGQGRLFSGWLTMCDPCSVCGRKFDRAPGYLLGSIYFNYGVTAMLVVVVYFSLFLTETMSGRQLLYVLAAFILVFPLWFFRYARGLWIAFDELFDPWPNEQEERDMARQSLEDQTTQ